MVEIASIVPGSDLSASRLGGASAEKYARMQGGVTAKQQKR